MFAHNSDILQWLLLAGASIDVPDNKSGRTALFHAAENRQFNLASILLQKNANVNVPCYAGTTPAQVNTNIKYTELKSMLLVEYSCMN